MSDPVVDRVASWVIEHNYDKFFDELYYKMVYDIRNGIRKTRPSYWYDSTVIQTMTGDIIVPKYRR